MDQSATSLDENQRAVPIRELVDSQWVEALFPFYVCVDENLLVTSVGASMVKLVRFDPSGIRLEEFLNFKRPKGEISFERMAKSRNTLFVARLNEPEVEFRGQFFFYTGKVFLLGSPRFGSVSDLNSSPISTSDFAATDQSVELMMMNVSNKRQVQQLKDMAVQLHDSAIREKVLSNIEKALEHDLNNAADIRIRLDSQLVIVDISVVKDGLLPWSEDEIKGRPVSQIFDRFPDQWVSRECDGSSALAIEFSQQIGSQKFEFDARITKSLDGGYLVLMHDKTEKVRAQREKEELQKQLQEAARNAGMAEVATGILHNVGNVLNSINVSANLIQQRFADSSLKQLVKAAAVIEARQESLAEFLTNDARGKHFPELFIQMAADLDDVQAFVAEEVTQLRRNIDHVKQIISIQQSLVKPAELIELVNASQLFEDALQVELAPLTNRGFEIFRNYDFVPEFRTSRHDVVQILINLIRNARQAYLDVGSKPKWIRLTLAKQGHELSFGVTDNGEGINPNLMVEIFRPGYTTRQGGNGFGLHASANSAQVLGGSLVVESEGKGKGATFTLTLPLNKFADEAI